MKLIKISAIPLLLFFYLCFSYVRFYNFIGKINLKSPYLDSHAMLQNAQGKGSVKYVALGDSLSAGVGSTNINSTFVYQHASHLSETYSKVTMLNLALPGGTTEDVLITQIPKALAEKPEFITLLIGTNDIHNKRTAKDFKDKYESILSELLTKTTSYITVLNIPYLGSSKLVYPPFNFLLNCRIKQFNRIISDVVNGVGNKDRIKLVDLYKATYLLSKQDQNYYSSDLFHPSSEGYLLWGKIINAD